MVWLNAPPVQPSVVWHCWHSVEKPCATWSGLLAWLKSAWWQDTHCSGVPSKLPTCAPGWHAKHAVAACAPTSGKRVRLCSAIWPCGTQLVSTWQLLHCGPSSPRWMSSWQPAQPRAANSATGPRSLWQRRHSACWCAPFSATPVCASWSKWKSARSSLQPEVVWHSEQSAGKVSCGTTGPRSSHHACGGTAPGGGVPRLTAASSRHAPSPMHTTAATRSRAESRARCLPTRRPSISEPLLQVEAEVKRRLVVPEAPLGEEREVPAAAQRRVEARAQRLLRDVLVAVQVRAAGERRGLPAQRAVSQALE